MSRFVLAHKMEIKILLSLPPNPPILICHSFSSKCVFMHTDSIRTHTHTHAPSNSEYSWRRVPHMWCVWGGALWRVNRRMCQLPWSFVLLPKILCTLVCVFKVFINLSGAKWITNIMGIIIWAFIFLFVWGCLYNPKDIIILLCINTEKV